MLGSAMASLNHVLLFPHEHVDLLSAMHDLNVRSKMRPQLRTLLTAASAVVHRHYAALDSLERKKIGHFEDIMELCEQHVLQHRPSVVVEMVLLTTIQIGQLVIFAEEYPSILSAREGDVLAPVGFGVGLIAAAVAATATNTDAIVRLGLEGVGIAFRLAIALQRTGRDVEDSDGIWNLVVAGFSPKELGQRLEKVNGMLQPLHRAYIGQVLPESIVVFGPPSTLESLAQTPDLSSAIASPSAPAGCPMYGSHLPPVGVDDIVGVSSVLDIFTTQRPLYSAHSPTRILSTRRLGEQLRIAVADIAHKPIQIEETIRTVAAALQEKGKNNSDVFLTMIGSTWDSSTVRGIFQQYDQSVHIGELSPCPKPFGEDIDSIPPDSIAVVGMSGRFPESDTLDEFWHLLETGTTTHQEIPSSRFSVDDFYDSSCSKHNALLARHGCFIKKPGDFDHRLFNTSPREALQMDPVQRMLLMTTYEALEMAGYSPPDAIDGERVAPRIATYFGQTTDDWKTINEQHGIDTHFLPAVNRGFAPGRLNHYFQWAGGFHSIDTGCSSSATTLCLARDALIAGQCDAAVVGGGTLLNAPEWFAGLSQGGFLSPTGACKTYSDSADGYCRGEGVAVVVLKRLTDAVKGKDNVLAVVAGASRNCNAGAGSITHPGQQAQAALYRRVLRQAAVQPQDVQVIEIHGTGTQAGDRVEMHAVKCVFAPPNKPSRAQPLIGGAVKANVGHSEAAAGVVSLIKAILILQRNCIPRQPGQPIALNPCLAPLLGSDIQLANGQAWPRDGTAPRYVFVNNFDAAGGNVSVLIHDPPSFALLPPPSKADVRTHHVVVTSGRTPIAQEANKSRLREFIEQNQDIQLADLAYTTTAKRMHQTHREAFVVSSIAELLYQLEKPIPSLSATAPASAPAQSVVFAFTGQGNQHVGMGGLLYRTSPTFRRLLDSYQQLCDVQGLACQLLDVIRGSVDATSTVTATTECNMQVATVALEIALARYWQALGLHPTLLIGHSLGEYAALCIAGVLSVSDALALAYERAMLIFTRCLPSEAGMLAVALPTSTVQWRLRDSAATAGCEVTCVNGPSSTVVGGPLPAIEALQEYLKSGGKVAVSRLRVQHAFHTQQMNPILDDLESKASRASFHSPTLPIASTLLGRIVQPGEDGIFNADYLRRHTREPVRFLDAVRAGEEKGLIQDESFVVEVGPHPTCIGLMASSLQKANPSAYPSLRRGRDDWDSISQCIAAAYRAQLPVSWTEFHKDHLENLRLMSNLPTYAFDNKSFWLSYKSKVTPNTLDAIPHASPSAASRLSSTCLHSIKDLRKDEAQILATFAVDLSDPHLAKAIGGHVVDGVAICPASIFIDMAYTAAAFLERESRPVPSKSLATYELADMSMHAPLVLREDIDEPPCVYVEGVLERSTDEVSVRFISLKVEASSSRVEYGSCLVRLSQPDAPCTQAWSRMQPLIGARVQSLNASLRPREVHAMDKRLFYKIFSEIVDYSTPYHAVEEAILAADFQDAAIVLQPALSKDFGTFTCSPFAIDALVHVAGFLLNADVRKPKNDVHIANHIGILRVVGDLSSMTRAYAIIREQDSKTGTSLCDVYATDDQDKLVALCTDICFKKLDRDFFALLTGSARPFPPKPGEKACPKRGWQQEKTADSISTSTTPTSVASVTSISSMSDAVGISAELLAAIAVRSGISVVELKKSTGTTFSDMGIDSQMSIAILASFKKATGIELPAGFFTNFPTADALQKELGNQQEHIADHEPTTRKVHEAPPKHRSRKQSPAKAGPSKQLFRLVADALGLEASDLTPSTTFESIGMDSMLSIKITSAFQHETQIELPAAFFTDQRTVAAAQEALDGPMEATVHKARSRSPSSVEKPHFSVAPALNSSSEPTRQHKIDSAESRAVLMRGHSRSLEAPLFMTTDGSGTVESYIYLSALPHGRRIYALESPFLESPDTFDLSIEEMASIFLRTIRRIQPRGPYLIGGWSAGSIYAYEVAYRLTSQGETISALFILDMRAPSLIPTSIVTTDFVNKLGTFEGINRARNLPEDLSVKERAHLMATCRALSRYDAPAFSADRQPRHVAVVWARLGLDDAKDAPIAAMCRPGLDIGKQLGEMTLPEFERYFSSWFYGRRKQFGTNGWETLLGDNISVHSVNGDHFSMMAPPFSAAVGTIVANTVMQAVAEE